MKAKKSLGQHFLKSESALAKIVSASDPRPTDIVLEIGPGTGILTERLLESVGKVIAIEKDRELVTLLKEKFSKQINEKRFELIEGDVLAFNPETLKHPYKLVANIPYYITGAIIEQFLSTKHQPTRMVLLMQKEVADRIVARDKKESVLSIAVKVYGIPKVIAKVPAGAFSPAPKVDSAILSIENVSREFFKDCNEENFFKLLKFVFGKKRGQLGGRLAEYIEDRGKAMEILNACNLDPKLRPENLTPKDWKCIIQKLVY